MATTGIMAMGIMAIMVTIIKGMEDTVVTIILVTTIMDMVTTTVSKGIRKYVFALIFTIFRSRVDL